MRDWVVGRVRSLQRAELLQPWTTSLVLIAVTVLAYLSVIRGGGFIWDDNSYVTDNLLLRSGRGLWDIWTRIGHGRGGTLQYYPLVFSSFWVEYHLWQLRPLGYHLVNVLLHGLNAVLVWRILRRLRAPGALLAGAIFALHPVHVESVAWVAERKNVLSGFFYLLSLLSYLRFCGMTEAGETSPEERRPRRRFYFLSFFLFLCALASKTVTGTLPAAILLILWWKNGRLGWRDFLLAAPMLILGAGSGLLTAHLEKYELGAHGRDWALTGVEHGLLAGRIPWFYAGRLLWPSRLTFIYPRWNVSQADWLQYLFPLAACAAIASLWAAREKIGRGPLTAALFFIGTLAPALGFVNVYPMRFSFVADHFQYLASLGLIALFAAAAARASLRLESRIGPNFGKTALLAAGTGLLPLGILTWRQGRIYKDADQVWIDTIEKNPSSWMAYNNLGLDLARQGKLEEAIPRYQAALRVRPDLEEIHYNLGVAFALQGRLDEAAEQFRETLRILPDSADARENLGVTLARQGRPDEAITQFQAALRINPGLIDARNNLSGVLDNQALAFAGQGKLEKAAARFGEALRMNPESLEAHFNLGVCLSSQGKADEALKEYKEALRIDPRFEPALKMLTGLSSAPGRSGSGERRPNRASR